MIDVDAEIKQAENTLQNANSIFQKHATKFNNKEDLETEPINLIERLEKVRKPKEMSATLESSNENFMRKKNTLFKWSKFAELKSISPEYMDNMSRMNVAGKASTFKKSEGTASEKRACHGDLNQIPAASSPGPVAKLAPPEFATCSAPA
ncbi:hypothetical protein KQX54_002093 [Cotesia glomerata]|uniref:Uncharacterized protein n=1 Tax=Cotesia glomerata TaxID=32391 RepID=A0AAV7J343_COTGL|nr:hypothetical protein KQX54_002093 [Cotesia glomerata]